MPTSTGEQAEIRRQARQAGSVLGKRNGVPQGRAVQSRDRLANSALFDCSPVSDGAVALLLVAEEIASQFTDKPLHVIGYGQGSDVPTYARES